MSERPEEEKREDKWEENSASDEDCEFIENYKLSSEKSSARTDCSDSSANNTDSYLAKCFLNALMTICVEGLYVMVS